MPRVAVIQTPGVALRAWRETWADLPKLARAAARQRADLAIFPECAWPAYYLESREAYLSARAAGMPGPAELLEHVADLARRLRLALVLGYVAEHADASSAAPMLRNAAALIDAAGRHVGTYEKCFLWDFDRRWFTRGLSIHPLDCPVGRIGMMICADNRIPEIPATLAARGAQLIVQPTAWVNAGTRAQPWNPQAEFLVAARALEFGVPVASASKWGAEGQTAFVGFSQIADASGNVLVRASSDETTVLVADVDLGPPVRRTRVSTELALALRSPPVDVRADVPPLRVRWQAPGREPGRLDSNAPTLVIALVPGSGNLPRTMLSLDGPREGVFECGGVRLAAIDGHAAGGFARVRALALSGVHAVVVFGETAPTILMRARAAENRIFVLHAQADGVDVIDPTGRVALHLGAPLTANGAEAGKGADVVECGMIDFSRAAEKNVAWQTNTLADRTPELYEY